MNEDDEFAKLSAEDQAKLALLGTGIRARWRQCNKAAGGEGPLILLPYNGVSQSEGRKGRHRRRRHRCWPYQR